METILVIKHFLVSATYVPSQDVLEQQIMETANYSALRIFCTSLFHCKQATATVLSQDKDSPVWRGYIELLLLFFLRIKTGPVWRGYVEFMY